MMKKLMMMFAAIAMVGAVQAATVAWTFGVAGMYDGTSSTLYSGPIYVYTTATSTQQALYEAFAADISYDFSKTANATVTLNDGFVNQTSKREASYFGESGTLYSLYFVAVKDDSIYFSQVREDQGGYPDQVSFYQQNDGSTTFSDVAAASGFQGAGRWSAVPEPTSGLLLLVGGALLALRRKRLR